MIEQLDQPQPMWQPSAERIAAANLTAFMRQCEQRWQRSFSDDAALHRWSVERREEFWASLWEYAGVIGSMGETVLVDGERMPGARWFPEARLNFAENLLRPDTGDAGLIFCGEDGRMRRFGHAELRCRVAELAAALRADGIVPGDRIAAWMPNLPETVIVMLAAASIGAVFTSASPDFGVQGVLDRFGQVEPKLLFVADSYVYNGKRIDCIEKAAQIVAQMPGLLRTVVCPYVQADGHDLSGIRAAAMLGDFVAPHAGTTDIGFARLPFDHPLYILYSSGTTGVPKCIVHGAGGTLLQHLKEHRLHCDLKPGDRLLYFTTCGWMMWNWLVSALASNVWVLLYDGSPFARDGDMLFDYAASERITHFGTSAKFIDACAKADLRPGARHDLSNLRVLLSTGSPLVPEGFDYVYRHIKADLQLASISGGTDIISCFVGGNPRAPVWRGEIQSAGLGMAVDVFDEDGKPVAGEKGEKGELVCTRAFPSMPLGFWNDADGAKYHAAYFARFANVWCHGDYAERTAHGGYIIHGRSDATLNPGGVRIGTAEIYRQVEKLPEVVESLVIGQHWRNDVRIVLFVKLKEGMALDEALCERIRRTILENTSPRHVPAKILQVADIPRTKSGKIVELAVRNVVQGEPVKNVEALANPEALDGFRDRAELAD